LRGGPRKSRNKRKSREVNFLIEDEEKETVLEKGQWKNRWTKAGHKPC